MSWQTFSYTKKGALIGAMISAFWIISGLTGTFSCGWNPVESSVVKPGICSNTIIMIIFYVPLLFFPLYPAFGAIAGWLVGKQKNRGYSNGLIAFFTTVLLLLLVILLYVLWMILARI